MSGWVGLGERAGRFERMGRDGEEIKGGREDGMGGRKEGKRTSVPWSIVLSIPLDCPPPPLLLLLSPCWFPPPPPDRSLVASCSMLSIASRLV